MNWFYAKNGAQQGPLSTDEMKNRIAAGEIGANDLAWREGMSDWMPVAQISELGVAAAAPASYESTPTPAAASSPVSPYQTPAAAPATQMTAGQPIPSYLWQSIVVTLFCCLPAGIAAIVYAAKVEGLKNSGNFAAAKEASDNAKKWTIISLVAGLLINLIVFALSASGALGQQ